ncbi:MAG: hypothetical protein V4574_15495 [Pseudomonadota bacterium]
MAEARIWNPDVPERPVGAFWRRLVLAFCLLMVVQDGHYAWIASGYSVVGSTGVTLDRTRCAADRFCPVTAVAPGSTGAKAMIVAGDAMRYDQWWRMYRSRPPGEALGITVRHEGIERHIALASVPRGRFSGLYIITAIFQGLLALTAALIVARAGTRRTSLLLGLAMACFAIPGPYPRAWQNAPGLFEFFFVTLTFLLEAGPMILAAAMLRFRREVTGVAPAWIRTAFWPVTALVMAGTAVGQFIAMNAAPLFGIADGLSMVSIIWALAAVFSATVLMTGWGRVPPADRTRYAFMAAAAIALCINAWIDPVIMLTTKDYTQASWPVVVQIVSVSLAAFLFAYAILRHRAIDLGFAVNRTLVYSVLSGSLVAAFVLAEKGVEKLLPEDAHNAGMLAQAAIALALFGVFHRLREAVESAVERVFFARWREYEGRIRAFIRQAPFFTRPVKLIEQTIEEIQRYTDGAQVALYRRVEDRYHRAGGRVAGVGQRVDPDIPAVVALRAERAPQRDGLGEAALLLPMVQRGEVFGFVALGPKPDGMPYRPDEEALLAETAQAIGLDLHALRVEELERENRRLAAARSDQLLS